MGKTTTKGTGKIMKEIKVFGKWISFGYGKLFGIGFEVDKYHFNINFLCFWFTLEF